MHIVFASLYAFAAWLYAFAWCILVGPPGSVWLVVVLAPFIFSGVVACLFAMSIACSALRWLWRRWRYQAGPGWEDPL